jgi:hypothetical protein
VPNRKNGGRKKNGQNQGSKKTLTSRSDPTAYQGSHPVPKEPQRGSPPKQDWEDTDHSYYRSRDTRELENIRPEQRNDTDRSRDTYTHEYLCENCDDTYPESGYTYYPGSDDTDYQESDYTTLDQQENTDYSTKIEYAPGSADLVYRCEQYISTHGKQYSLEDKFILSNPDITRKLRDQLTVTLQPWIKKNLCFYPFQWKSYYKGNPPITVAYTEREFEGCDGKNDLNSLLRYIQCIRHLNIDKDVINRLSYDRNRMSHGAHINTRVGRNYDGVKDLFKDVNYLLTKLHIRDTIIEELEKSFDQLSKIRQNAKYIKQNALSEIQLTSILNYIAVNQDNPSVKELISFVIAPRLINLEDVIYINN